MHRRASKVDGVLHHVQTAVGLLRDIAEGTDLSYLKPVAGISLLILDTVHIVKTNREQCLQMVEHIYEIICVIINVCEVDSGLSSAMLRSISTFIQTLQKVHSFIRSQLDRGLVKRLVRHVENAQQIGECKAALRHAMDLFGVQRGILNSAAVAELHGATLKRHQELLDYLADSSQHDQKSIQGSLVVAISSVAQFLSENPQFSFQTGSNSSSFLLLPGSPKIFYGRDAELREIMTSLLQPEAARIAILGPGGIGKSALSLTVLHHPEIISKFGLSRHFVACDAANSAVELVSLVGSFFGLKQQSNSAKGIVKHLSATASPIVLVLDNLETSWEPPESRTEVEEFLGVLANIKHLCLIVTMRGIERPARIKWSRPFLSPLRPLSDVAARQTFVDIADDVDDEHQLREILSFTDNLPLAVSLMANLVSYEGCTEVIRRWETQKTSLLSAGAGKGSSLEKSIALSLTSQRMASHPDALQLLSLLSVLPDGLSDHVLKQLMLTMPFQNLKSKSTLVRTSLAYIDFDQRLKVLAPIREYVRHLHPPTSALVTPLLEYFFDLVGLFDSYQQLPSGDLLLRITSDFGNIVSLLQIGLQPENPRRTIEAAIGCTISLAIFTRVTVRGSIELFRSIARMVEAFGDMSLLGQYLLEFSELPDKTIPVIASLERAKQCFEAVGDITRVALAYERLSWHYLMTANRAKALEYDNLSVEAADKGGDPRMQAKIYYTRARLRHVIGRYEEGVDLGRKCVALSQSAGTIYYEAQGNDIQARCLARMGNYGSAARHSDHAMALIQALGLDQMSNVGRDMLNARAEILLQKTEYRATREIYATMVGWESSTSGFGLVQHAYTLLNLIVIDCATANFEGVQELIDSARSILSSVYSSGEGQAVCDLAQGDLELGLLRLDAAEDFYRRGLAFHRDHHAEMAVWALQKLGDVALARGDFSAALPRLVTHFAFARTVQNWKEVNASLQRIGDVFVAEGDDATACSLFLLALDNFTAMDIHQAKADCMFRIGDIRRRSGDLNEARDWWARARPLFEKSSQAVDVRRCDARLSEYKNA
ncbi:hypothetical protein FB451DRAFT_1359182 [Mycena latifolia]|nr:hypothetical protein FB451DRAFT_1359182 [Mycena latifolia]